MTVRSALRAPVRAAVRAPIILRKRWTPAALFAQGQQGVWYEPKPEYLFQDAAGTVPVTADGDPVGYMQDLSGNGNHATQSTSAARPTYRTDGVLHWLEPDGVDDSLVTGVVDLTAYTTLTLSAGLRKLSDSQGVSPVFMSGPDGSATNGFSMYAPHKTSSRKAAWSLGGLTQRFRALDGSPAPATLIQSALYDNAAAALSDAIVPRINGQQVTPTEDVSGKASGSGFLNDTLRLFAQIGTSDHSPNPLYGLALVSGHLDDADLSSLETHLASLAGVTI